MGKKMNLTVNGAKPNNITITHPKIAAQWDYEKNGDVRPEMVTHGSNKKYFWLCDCGHSWIASVVNRTNNNNGCPICGKESMRKKKRTPKPGRSLAEMDPELAKEWHPTKNGTLTPKDVSIRSSQSVWWLCAKCGNEWMTTVVSRACGYGCHKCTLKKLSTPEEGKSFADVYPDAATFWHPTMNGDLTPWDVTPKSNKAVWWLCPTCGGEWQAKVGQRAISKVCPFCSGKRIKLSFNDLATTHPELASEWCQPKNGDLTPEMVTAGSSKKVWWTCSRGHEWEASIYTRSKGHGCPFCSGQRAYGGFNDLATEHPELAKEWHPTKNGDVTPESVTSGSGYLAWWLGECGHEWQAAVYSRVAGNNCAYCSCKKRLTGFNDLATVNKEIASQWDYERNEGMTPDQFTKYSDKKVWWVCSKGHHYEATISNRTIGRGCPHCRHMHRTSFPERAVGNYIITHRDVENARPDIDGIGGMEFDNWLPDIKTVVEYDGQAWHQDVERDLRKDKFCEEHGIRIIRIREPKCPVYESNAEFVYRKDTTTSESLNEVIRQVCRMVGRDDSDVDVDRDRHIIEQMVEYKPGDQTGVYHQLSIF